MIGVGSPLPAETWECPPKLPHEAKNAMEQVSMIIMSMEAIPYCIAAQHAHINTTESPPVMSTAIFDGWCWIPCLQRLENALPSCPMDPSKPWNISAVNSVSMEAIPYRNATQPSSPTSSRAPSPVYALYW